MERTGQRSAAWLDRLYGDGPNREWVYGRVPRGILVEELLVGADGGLPDDHKLFVFHGRCRYVQVDRGRFGRRTQDFFTSDWSHLALSGGHPWAEPTPDPPRQLGQMIEIAERLGAETDFVRVDLYLVGTGSSWASSPASRPPVTARSSRRPSTWCLRTLRLDDSVSLVLRAVSSSR